MAVYNSSDYVGDAIQSILNQSYPLFELIIIDDGSTDRSLEVIKSFQDPRIVIIKHEQNLGVSKSRNNGIQIATGEFVAIFDSDDLSLPDRLKTQIEHLILNSQIDVVASTIIKIDSSGHKVGFWHSDIKNVHPHDIIRTLPFENCIAQSSIMMRSKIAKKYQYDPKLKAGEEDYELWLRLTAENVIIDKIEQPLVLYRVHSKSATQKSNNLHLKALNNVIRTKHVFLTKYLFKPIKLTIKLAVIFNLVFNISEYLLILLAHVFFKLGVITYKCIPLLKNHRIFLFFPFYHVGGAERVHVQIAECLSDQKPVIFFTHLSANNRFKSQFQKYALTFNIVLFKKLPILKQFLMGYLSILISSTKGAVVFGCNSDFFYDLLPFLSIETRKIDLTHAASGDGELKNLPRVPCLDHRIIITSQLLDTFKDLYSKNGIDQIFLNRFSVIENCATIPQSYTEKNWSLLNILYIGRESEEKRIHLIGQIAQKCVEHELKVTFNIIGPRESSVYPKDRKFLNFRGTITDDTIIRSYYQKSHLLLLTSRYEGFPLVIMEAMGYGVIPITTNVGGISQHIKHFENGILLTENSENNIIEECVKQISNLEKNQEVLKDMSLKAYNYANQHFTNSNFCNNYRQLLVA